MGSHWGFWYKGTRVRVQVGDSVQISERVAKELGVSRDGIVTELKGFISVQLSNGDVVDFDARQIKQIAGK